MQKSNVNVEIMPRVLLRIPLTEMIAAVVLQAQMDSNIPTSNS